MRTINRIRNRVTDFVLSYLSRGITPGQLAIAVTIGLILGIFPMLGTTTLLCFVAGTLLRLNQPVLQAANYLVSPLQYLLLMPFIRLGEKILRTPPLQLSLSQIQQMIKTNLAAAIHQLWDATLNAIAAWAIVAVPAGVLIALLLFMFFRRIAGKFTAKRSSTQMAD